MPKANFEDALNRLEEAAQNLERGELTLDEALKIFEEGIRWGRLCHQRLSEAEQRVHTLVRDAEGNLGVALFPVESERDQVQNDVPSAEK